MRCYIWGTNNLADRSQRGSGVVSFAIPDWGIQFRAAQIGTAGDCEYAALMAFLRFVETNPKLFEGKQLDIFTDATTLVYQVNGKMPAVPADARSLALVQSLRGRIPFELSWVPPEQNSAIQGILHLAPLKMKAPIQYTAGDRKKASDKPSPRNPSL